MFVLRAKVKIEELSADHLILALGGGKNGTGNFFERTNPTEIHMV